jgi:hypothetical protein
MTYEIIIHDRRIRTLPHITSPVCSAAAISGHSRRVGPWFDIYMSASGGSTVEVCAAVSGGVDGDDHYNRCRYERSHGPAVDVQSAQPIHNKVPSHL